MLPTLKKEINFQSFNEKDILSCCNQHSKITLFFPISTDRAKNLFTAGLIYSKHFSCIVLLAVKPRQDAQELVTNF